eukprot:1155693-Pelagomonas_calceolata.AAC.7
MHASTIHRVYGPATCRCACFLSCKLMVAPTLTAFKKRAEKYAKWQVASCRPANLEELEMECAPVISLNTNNTGCVNPGIQQARKARLSLVTKEFVTCVSIKVGNDKDDTEMFLRIARNTAHGSQYLATLYSVQGQELCQTESRSWIQCPEASLQRTTVTGLPCRIPFEIKGLVGGSAGMCAAYPPNLVFLEDVFMAKQRNV